jgi:hypothetical protein
MRRVTKEWICNTESIDCMKVRRDQWERKYIEVYYKNI